MPATTSWRTWPGLLLGMGLVQSPFVLATGALRGRSAEAPGTLVHEEAGDHLPHHNQRPALHEDTRWRGRGWFQKLQREEDEDRALRVLGDGEGTESSLRLEFYEANSTPIVFPPTAECLTTNHQSSVVWDDSFGPAVLVGADNVWDRLQQAASARGQCPSLPCCQGTHIHAYGGLDLGEEMSHVRGAIVVRRPDLTRSRGMLAPARSVDFVATLQTYFPTSEESLLRRMVEADSLNATADYHTYLRYPTLLDASLFVDAVREGNSAAGELLTPYCKTEEIGVPRRAIEECLRTPTVVSMADVFINKAGCIWNEKDLVAPISCDSRQEVLREEQAREHAPTEVQSYEKVFVMTQEWGPNYYHFTVEHLPRIMVFLDVLLENEDIRIAVHHHGSDAWHNEAKQYETHVELLELLGINRERIVVVNEDIHADLAILPTSTVCGDPDTHMVNMLRHALLQALYPSSGGVPAPLPRPTIVLIVRESLRGLRNNDSVKLALQSNFPDHDVVEFSGVDPARQQLETFATAAMVVAPHGAGLANILVAPLHTPVLEVAPISCPPCFLRLALKLHHVYARHPTAEWDSECFRWYEPDVDEIVGLARDLLEAKSQADAADPPTADELPP